MSKIISIVNQKGGVGKSTTTVNLGAYLTSFNKKVLIIDSDPQGNATSGLGIVKEKVHLTTYDLLLNEKVKKNDIITKTNYENLHIIPANINLAGAEVELVSAISRERLLYNALKEIDYNYDYILIDCQPSLGLLTINALVASNSVLVPIQCEYYALEGLGQLFQTISMVKEKIDLTIEIEGLLLTMYDARTNLSAQVKEEVKKYFNEKVYKTVIPRNIRAAEAPSFGKPLINYAPKSSAAKAYDKLTEEFLNREENGDIRHEKKSS